MLTNKIKILEVGRKFKEFYVLAKIYTDINKNVGLLNNINCEEEGEVINTEDDGKIRNLIYNKFVLVYNDNKIKLKYDIGQWEF